MKSMHSGIALPSEEEARLLSLEQWGQAIRDMRDFQGAEFLQALQKQFIDNEYFLKLNAFIIRVIGNADSFPKTDGNLIINALAVLNTTKNVLNELPQALEKNRPLIFLAGLNVDVNELIKAIETAEKAAQMANMGSRKDSASILLCTFAALAVLAFFAALVVGLVTGGIAFVILSAVAFGLCVFAMPSARAAQKYFDSRCKRLDPKHENFDAQNKDHVKPNSPERTFVKAVGLFAQEVTKARAFAKPQPEAGSASQLKA